MKYLILVVVVAFGAYHLFFNSGKSIDVRVGSKKFTYKYIEKTNSSAGKLSPLIVALHGNGDTPEKFYKTMFKQIENSNSTVLLIKAPYSYASGTSWPIRPDLVESHGDAVNNIVKIYTQKNPALGKPIVFGFSGGAIMANYLASRYADEYSYIFALSGRMISTLDKNCKKSDDLATVIVYHGTNDEIFPYDNIKDIIPLMKKCLDVEFNTLSGSGHLGPFQSDNQTIMDRLEEVIDDFSLL